MPDLGKAYVQIVPSAEGISGSITKAIKGESVAAGAAGGKAMMGSMLKVVGAAGAAGAVAKLLYSGIKTAVGEYANYEQLTGGVETLFKDSADIVMDYAENAYKTAGLSANEYMETVTSFSASLLQSLGGDTAKAAEKADLAITDMSDNANKMGTAMESIQNAYQGFAKQNYTMLDNLKLGYGGTKEEMERLLEDAEKLSGIHYDISSYADIVDAIHVVQTEMGITGTTAKEASETISGSISSARAAIGNLVTGLGDADADLIGLMDDAGQSVLTAAGNVAEAIGTVISAPIRAIAQAADPVNKMNRELKNMADAQAEIGKTDSILDLIDRYDSLEERLKQSSISSVEAKAVEREMTEIREQLAVATGNAALAQEGFGQEIDDAIAKERFLAEMEEERAKIDLYESSVKGSQGYLETMDEIRRLTMELQDAETDLSNARDATAQSSEDAYDSLVESLEELEDAFDEDTISSEDLRAGLDRLEEQYEALSGNEIDFTEIGGARDAIDKLDISAESMGMTFADAFDRVEELKAALARLGTDTDAYRDGVLSLVHDGLMTGAQAAELLGISTIELGYKMQELTKDEAGAAEAANVLADALEEVSEEQAAHDALIGIASAAIDARISGGDLREEYNKLSDEFDKVKDSGDKTAVELAEQKLQMLNLAATNQELVKGLKDIPGAMDYAKDKAGSLSAALINAGYSADDYVNSVANMRDSVVNSYHILIDESSITADEMGEALSANKTTMLQWQQDLKDLWWQAYADQDTAAMQYIMHLEGLGPSYAAAVHDFASGGYDELQSQAQDFADIGRTSTEMLADEMSANAYLAGDSGSEIANAGIDAMNEADWSAPGGDAISDWASGATGNSSAASRAAQSVVSGAENAADNKTSEFWYVGWNMDQGIISGINDGSGLIEAAARAAALKAYRAAQAALDIHSPSKLFRDDIGKAIPEGLAIGIERNAELVTRAMRDLSDATVGEYRIRGLDMRNYEMSRAQLASDISGSNYSNVVNVTVNGAENPEDYAVRLARQLKLQMRMV